MQSLWCTLAWWAFANDAVPLTFILKSVAHPISCTDRAAHGVGACGVPQHTQEDGVMSPGTHRCRCRKETCKEKNILLMAASFPTVSCFSICNVSHTSSQSLFQSVHTSSQVICLLFFCPPPSLKHALQSVPRLYTGNGQVKHTQSSSFRLSGSWRRLFHFPFWHLLSSHTMHDTLAFGIFLQKQDVQNFCRFSLTDVVKVDRWLSIAYRL